MLQLWSTYFAPCRIAERPWKQLSAILNYLYGVLESGTRFASSAPGLDLSLSVLHANTLGSCAKEDRHCAEGAMGEGEGGQEDALALD